MRETQQQGKDVQAAIEAGLAQLRLRRDQVEVVIKEKGSSGFFGIGSKPAVVVIREKRWETRGGEGGGRSSGGRSSGGRGGRSSGGRGGRSSGGREGGGQRRFDRGPARPRREKEFTNYERPEKVQCPTDAYEEVQLTPEQPLPKQALQPVPEASLQAANDSRQALEQVLNLLGVKCENMESGWDPSQERLVLRFDTDSPALIIGKEGQTIEALQYVVTLMVARKHNLSFAIQVETGSYWAKIEQRLVTQVNRAVEMVKSTNRNFRLQAMSSMQRRFVHRLLCNNPDVETFSEGESKWRKVVVKPRKNPVEAKPAQEAQPQAAAQVAEAETPVEATKGE